jgi:ABC-type Fe3+-hydroxamate transport system substrate-binding protein
MKSKAICFIVVALLMVLLAGCGASQPAANTSEGGIKIIDDFKQTITLKQPAKRIISFIQRIPKTC